MSNKQLGLTVILVLILSFHAFAQSEEVRVEGVIYDGANPQDSLAAINGEFLRVGDSYQDYDLTSIKPNSIVLTHKKTGKNYEVEVKAKALLPEIPAPEPAPMPAEKPEDILSRVKGTLSKLNPMTFAERVGELRAVVGLRDVYNAGMFYFMEKETLPKDIKTLVETGFLQAEYADSTEGKYEFTLDFQGQYPTVRAEPVDKGANLHYFLMDRNGMIHYEKNKAASERSPIYEF